MSTIRDVARLAEVSISTVSLTLNSPERVHKETAKRVLEAANALGYSADPVAQSLKSGTNKLIGMVVESVGNPFFSQVLMEVERHAVDHGYLVTVSDTAGDPLRERALLSHLRAQRAAGIILTSCEVDPVEQAKLHKLKMPIVMFDHNLQGFQGDFVGGDNELATAMLTEHLIRLGHRNIAMLAGTDGLYTARKRIAGFVDTMTKSGLEVPAERILDGGYEATKAYEQTMRLLTLKERPSAIIAASNVMSLGALRAIKALGIDCPSEVSLTSVDDVPWSDLIQPRITTALQPLEEMARAASAMIMERLRQSRHEDHAPVERIFAPQLVIGESSGPYRGA